MLLKEQAKMEKLLNNLKNSSKSLSIITQTQRENLIINISNEIMNAKDEILSANKLDLDLAQDLSSALKDRLKLTSKSIENLCDSIKNIANLKEVIGVIKDGWQTKSGLKIEKITVPLGNIATIYESRPNVTAEVAALCIKSANGCALKGGKEARNTNLAIIKAIHKALQKCGLDKNCVVYLDIDRSEVEKLIKMDKYLDLIVPRGGENLVKFVSQNATIPVLKHDKGLCHIYVDEFADLDKALNICVNAKCSRPGVCNAAETILVHEAVANEFIPNLKKSLDQFNVIIFGCKKTAKIIDCELANEQNYSTEYLDFKLNLKIVKNLEESLEHISEFSSGHSEAVISENYSVCEMFLNLVNSACVYANASTRFSDGGEFGFGAEIGISTNKLHARGPVGLNELTTYKYIIRANGQIR
ncbi:glutamate-5-semialdehyde dehydrogenase [Campylobacter fetus]|uniref:glutamate-5-semialdehyde dehydrogenase n=1 Tax=Campylobacter fetus TaxID=196 RepID=UPI0009BE83A2|nr:glutamate-5-semialdehyde dehydrogenase [Campylobacter fetus]EAK0830774.1 glutamate-5-semialdehyde dehydrogenase [Campylobacter fetus]